MFKFFHKQKKWFQKPRIILIAAILVAFTAVVYAAGIGGNGEADTTNEQTQAVAVRTAVVGELAAEQAIEVSGVVKPATQIDIVALANGAVRSIAAQVGDTVAAGQLLVELSDATALANLNNASVSFNNTQLSSETAKNVASESVRQAEIGVQNATEAVATAQINLASAQTTQQNTLALQAQDKSNLQTNAVIAVQDYLNATNNALSQVNYLIKAEGNSQLPGVAPTLGVLDPQSLPNARDQYQRTKDAYVTARAKSYTETTVAADLANVVTLLSQTLATVDAAIETLDNTVVSLTFTDASLIAQKSAFASLRSSVATSLSAAQKTRQGLLQIDLTHKQQADSLASAVATAQSQLSAAELSLSSAQVVLTQAQASYNQQVILSQSNIDASRGQLQLIQTQIADLTVGSPISGTVTHVYAELGDEAAIGTPLMQVSQSNLVTIEVDVTSEEVYAVALGQVVTINDSLEGFVATIDPVADPVTRKIGIEIAFDNSKNELIPETFVTVTIPTTATVASDTMLVPLTAVTITQLDRFVFVVDGDTARKVPVTIGVIVGDQIEITDGLVATDELIVSGNKLLEDGSAISVIQ